MIIRITYKGYNISLPTTLRLANIFPVYCVKISADDRGIHNASCENVLPVYFLTKFDTS